MGLVKFKNQGQKGGAAPTILKKVLQQSGLLVCGVCRKAYPNFALANNCLNTCMANLEKTSQVISTTNPKTGVTQHKCPVCARQYDNKQLAQNCLESCTKRTKTTFTPAPTPDLDTALAAVAATNQMKDNRPAQSGPAQVPLAYKDGRGGRNEFDEVITTKMLDRGKSTDKDKFFREGARYICRRCKSKYFSRDEVVACFDLPCSEPEKVVADPKDETQLNKKPESEFKRTKTSKDDAQKFYRDGARYVCRECDARFFTRDEVFACFDAHG